jgi:phosphoglucosamine mutase
LAERKYFGTDGVRGIANTELSPTLAMSLGAAAAIVLGDPCAARQAPCEVVVGRDPRISGDILESALVAGLCGLGVHVTALGVLPTPGVAFVTRERGAAAGVVISASHNPVADNGIKFFGPDGRKLPDDQEARIEAAMEGWEAHPRPGGADVGRLTRTEQPVETYAAHLRAACPGSLHGLRLVADCANGSASYLGPRVLAELGAEVITLNAQPDGVNINENCGSLHPEAMAARVVAERADAGLSFDGDADRVILADETGRIVDGDRVLCLAGLHLAREDRLPGRVVVGTVMSNLGLEQALGRHGIRLIRAAVGDRYVAEEMARTGAVLGGEKSGHILFAEHTTTGDGILTALQVLHICRQSGRKLAEWAEEMQELPQILRNVRVGRREGWRDVPAVAAALGRAEAALQGRGRILVRPSGTEKMIRVMAEGPDLEEIEALVGAVADALQVHLGV